MRGSSNSLTLSFIEPEPNAFSIRELLLWIAGCRIQQNYVLTNLFLTASIFGTFGGAPIETPKETQLANIRCAPASWYGPGFHNNRTANGERYYQNGITAAHRTLPFGTRVRVTNKLTGKSVVVRINDRGPFHGNRELDLSRGAAEKVGLLHSGVAPVCYKVI